MSVNIKQVNNTNNIPYILNGELFQITSQKGDCVTVKCCNCPDDRMYRGSVRSTGNFHMHIKRKHPELLVRLHELKVGALLIRKEHLMRTRKSSLRIRTKVKKEITEKHVQCDQFSDNIWQEQEPIDYSINKTYNNKPPHTKTKLQIVTQIHCRSLSPITSSFNVPLVKNEFLPMDAQNYAGPLDLSTTNAIVANNDGLAILENHQIDSQQFILANQANNSGQSNLSTQWIDVLSRVESSLKNIEREMRTRNQIENNRIYLELAKFKFVHPSFDYQS